MVNPRDYMLIVIVLNADNVYSFCPVSDLPEFWLDFVNDTHKIELVVMPFVQRYDGAAFVGFVIAPTVFEGEAALLGVERYLDDVSRSGGMDLSAKNSPN